jgi:hypothetical protein
MATAQGYIDEVKLRISRLGVVSSLNDPFVLTCINRARHEVQKNTLTLYPERYGKILNLATFANDAYSEINLPASNKVVGVIYYTLPDDFIEPYVVLLKWGGNVSEARQVAKRELFNVGKNAWNYPTSGRPVCATERYNNAGVWEWRLYVSDVSAIANYSVDLWYVAAIDEIENADVADLDDTEVTIPPNIEELVLLYSMLYCLENINIEWAYQSIGAEIKIAESVISQDYMLKEVLQEQKLPSKEGI